MPDLIEPHPELKKKKAAIEAFLSALWTSAKTTGLYKEGHPTILQICERVSLLLQKTLGQDTALTIDIKAKSASIEDMELAETPDVLAFSSALHTLGIGQVLLTNRLAKEGVYEFCKVLTLKPDDKTSLTDLQKAVQGTRIDGLQLSFILSFVVTGDAEPQAQTPGRLTEEQVAAFIRAKTLPDFLTLLLRQNEPLSGKVAESVTSLLEDVLYREAAVERFETEMPWDLYDPRIRARWNEFRAALSRPPKTRGAGGRRAPVPKAERAAGPPAAAASWLSVYEDSDIAAFKVHHGHEKKDALRFSLAAVHDILDRPRTPAQLKYAVFAYVRVLAEMGKDGDVKALLSEYARWQALSGDAAAASLFAVLQAEIQAKVMSPAFAEQFAAFLGTVVDEAEFRTVVGFTLFFGPPIVPLLLDQLRNVTDKAHRGKLCYLLSNVCKLMGVQTLIPALKDDDWFLVVNVVMILMEIADPAHGVHVAPLLKHKNAKVQEAAVRFTGKFASPAGIDGLGEFILRCEDSQLAGKAVIALSLLVGDGIDAKLIAAYAKTKNYETKVSIVRALGRFATNESLAVLKDAARRTWSEILLGRKKDLHLAAVHSLEQLRKEGKV